jgi:hypothetical protein
MGRRARRGAGECPKCRATIEFRDVSPSQRHRATIPLYLVGAVAALIWATFLIRNEFLVVARNVEGMALVCGIYAAPGVAIAWFAQRLPRWSRAQCPECDWSGEISRKY